MVPGGARRRPLQRGVTDAAGQIRPGRAPLDTHGRHFGQGALPASHVARRTQADRLALDLCEGWDGEPGAVQLLRSAGRHADASIGWRAGEPKDTLRNILDTRAFCINVVTEPQLEAMNATSGDYPRGVDEFKVAGLPMANGSLVRAPYVENCPAVMECRLYKEVALGTASNNLLLGEVLAVRLGSELRLVPGTQHVETESLKPVGRLFASGYTLLGKIKTVPRPQVG
jgi:flavin reductase (DIM6/NTAB) family NADH-FMN oxidoreductase RutF